MEKARSAALRALALDEDSGLAHAALPVAGVGREALGDVVAVHRRPLQRGLGELEDCVAGVAYEPGAGLDQPLAQ